MLSGSTPLSMTEESAYAKMGDTVRIHYTGKLEDGTVFDSSQGKEPIEFVIGGGMVISGFENAVLGMKPGEEKTNEIPVEEGYGQRNEQLVLEIERSSLPEECVPELGMQLHIQQSEGAVLPVVITDVTEENVTIDANHPLAGLSLTFDIELVEIVSEE
ncbi:FKBP-type peptidyl-prolyl cis-trans isomerase [Methanoplanus limicola]|uniref:Peptidyl-prolyl cis-trans isomerase n=1 Tax=Methanoplanus limicola DSM 2279 TaxID=937775 RepID=H1Z3L4_9EURY|nr:peptidylprolyl isomerase [Methanoplanus limicola]EHQ35613.1 peptidylprolyl isomerase FKBP-type [Methanoplanus limicola DSM 2279]